MNENTGKENRGKENRADTSSKIIRLQNITRKYLLGSTTVNALRGVNLEIERGEFSVILGPSGSGKSTLLNIIGCLDEATSGEYILDGIRINGRPVSSLAATRNQKIGFIFQSFNLIPVLNVEENIELPCLLGTGRKEDPKALRQRVRALCEEVGLTNHLKHKPDELSGGQRQRVAIARALVTNPLMIMADEPTANLDSKTSETILDLMQALNKRDGVTFVFATHDPRVVERTHRTYHIADGIVAS